MIRPSSVVLIPSVLHGAQSALRLILSIPLQSCVYLCLTYSVFARSLASLIFCFWSCPEPGSRLPSHFSPTLQDRWSYLSLSAKPRPSLEQEETSLLL